MREKLEFEKLASNDQYLTNEPAGADALKAIQAERFLKERAIDGMRQLSYLLEDERIKVAEMRRKLGAVREIAVYSGSRPDGICVCGECVSLRLRTVLDA